MEKGTERKNVDSKMRGQEVRAEELKTNTSKKKGGWGGWGGRGTKIRIHPRPEPAWKKNEKFLSLIETLLGAASSVAGCSGLSPALEAGGVASTAHPWLGQWHPPHLLPSHPLHLHLHLCHPHPLYPRPPLPLYASCLLLLP